MTNLKQKAWIGALRLRTLPLAAGGIILGSFLPETLTYFSWPVFILALVTAFGLQILSNLANDYGDYEKGTDNENRVGPVRALQSGVIGKAEMKKALLFCGTLTLLSGIALLFFAFGTAQLPKMLLMFSIGIAAIWAAVKYTVGKSAYGYIGLGDVFVILFFGPVSVVGVSFLYLHELNPAILFPALSYGLLSAGVLNINNMRDIDNDRSSGKRTLVVIMGANAARLYHFTLITLALAGYIIYLDHTQGNPLALLSFLPVLINSILVLKHRPDPAGYNRFLKGLAISSLINVLFFTLLLSLL